MPPTNAHRGRNDFYWADESDSWPSLSHEHRAPPPGRWIAVVLVVALMTVAGLMAFAGGVLSRPAPRGEVEAR